MPLGLLITLSVSTLAQSFWVLVIGRVLADAGWPAAKLKSTWLAALCALGPFYIFAADRLNTTLLGSAVSDGDVLSFLLLVFIPPLALAVIGTLARRESVLLRIFLCGWGSTMLASLLVWALVAMLHVRFAGVAIESGVAIVPCALWHVVTGPALLAWANRAGVPIGLCKRCGYNLAGLPAATPCPECGTPPAAPNRVLEKGVLPGG